MLRRMMNKMMFINESLHSLNLATIFFKLLCHYFQTCSSIEIPVEINPYWSLLLFFVRRLVVLFLVILSFSSYY